MTNGVTAATGGGAAGRRRWRHRRCVVKHTHSTHGDSEGRGGGGGVGRGLHGAGGLVQGAARHAPSAPRPLRGGLWVNTQTNTSNNKSIIKSMDPWSATSALF